MKKIFLATKNRGKIKELKEILEGIDGVVVQSMADGIVTPDIVEDGVTFEENSRKKGIETARFLNSYVIADDSGICAEGLNGEPGVYSARYAGENATDEENNQKLIRELSKIENRKVKYVAVITCASPSGETISFEGDVEGEFIFERRGENGFGYDPYFYLPEYNMTFGELPSDIKNRISHRAKAMEKLKQEIKTFLK